MKLKNSEIISEEVFIRPYSVQAVARKRNSMMNALQLNDNEFMNWVRDRLYRLAQQNKLSIKDLTIDMITAGFREWENTFRQSDKDFDQYMDEFSSYSQKFMKFSSRILKSNITDPDPNKLKPSEDSVPPVSPKMVKFQISDNEKK